MRLLEYERLIVPPGRYTRRSRTGAPLRRHRTGGPFISPTSDYVELKTRLSERGVFSQQLSYYAFQAFFTLGLLVLSVAFLFLLDGLWLRLLNAALLAFVFTHLAYIIHDAGHRQILGHPGQNDFVMLLLGLLVGSSRSWWFETHNLHHANPNDLDRDPNMAIVVLAFSEDQAKGRGRLLRVITRFQAYYFFPLLFLEGVGVRLASIKFVIAGKSKYPALEALALGAHFTLYAWLLFTAMPASVAVLFILVHQGLAGLYMGSVFAPNHKGMLVLCEDTALDFVRRQVLSSRNIKPHPFVDFWYGGLNYQIEHHLFPMIPRTKLKAAHMIVKDFCTERSIAYHETNVWQAYGEILRYLSEVVTPLGTSSTELGEVRPA